MNDALYNSDIYSTLMDLQIDELIEEQEKKNIEKHKWQETPVTPGLVETFFKRWECIRGDCKCERLQSKWGGFQYSRSGIHYDYCPECFGDVPISDQNNVD